jgi:hypothetical protein
VGEEEVSKLVNPMISCCSCPSLHQVLLQIRGMERVSAGATKDKCRHCKGRMQAIKQDEYRRVQTLQWTCAGATKNECRRYKGRVQAL